MQLEGVRISGEALSLVSAGAAKGLLTKILPEFSRQANVTVQASYAPVGAIHKRVLAGENADVLVMTGRNLQDLAARGYMSRDLIQELGVVGVGIAVPEADPAPDLSTTAALRSALLTANALIYADPDGGATSGIHFTEVLRILKISDAVRKKSLLVPGGEAVAQATAATPGSLGVQQVSEIIGAPGVILAGPLPGELQKKSMYAAGILNRHKLAVATKLMQFLARPETREQARSFGFQIQDGTPIPRRGLQQKS